MNYVFTHFFVFIYLFIIQTYAMYIDGGIVGNLVGFFNETTIWLLLKIIMFFHASLKYILYDSLLAMLDNMPVLLADEDKLSPMEQSSSSTDDRSLVDNLNFFKDEIYQLREHNRSLQQRL